MKSFLRATALVLSSVLASQANAAMCTAGTVASTQNTSCTIGDMMFTFGQASVHDHFHVSLDTLGDFKFTPFTDAVGFSITGSLTNTAGATDPIFNSQELEWAGVSFATLSGAKTVVGLTVADVATNNGMGTARPYAEFVEFDLGDSSNYVFVQPMASPAECPGLTCTRAFATGPVSATASNGRVTALASAVNLGGSVTATETDFYVNEQTLPAVPEPATCD